MNVFQGKHWLSLADLIIIYIQDANLAPSISLI